jgi:hypothetical protein
MNNHGSGKVIYRFDSVPAEDLRIGAFFFWTWFASAPGQEAKG